MASKWVSAKKIKEVYSLLVKAFIFHFVANMCIFFGLGCFFTGVVSFGIGCGRKEFPGVYSRVSGAMEFINAGLCTLTTEDRPEFCPDNNDDTEPPTTPPTTTTTPDDSKVPLEGGTSKLVIIIQYDWYASETTWELSQNGGNVLYSFPDDSDTPQTELQNKLKSYVFDEIPTGEYTFTMNDSLGDGLSGSYENPQVGFFVIEQHAVVENDDGDDCGNNINKEILAVGDHVFSSSKSVSFTVVASTSSS
jgi:hypothetical protein